MAIGIIIASVAIAGALSAYAIMQGRKVKNADMRGTEGFTPTYATEGATVSLIYGRVRVPGNIIWYGNLTSKKTKTKSSGGKGEMMGGGNSGGEQVDYYCDCWQAVGIGKLTLIDTYVNDEKAEIEATSKTWNDGTQATYPTEPGSDANKVKGVAHIFIKRWFLGGTAQIPTVHYVVERVLATPLVYQNLSNGSNPAAVIYDLLTQAGVDGSRIDQDSFNNAATYFNSAGYGINIAFDSQVTTSDAIDQILSYVEAIVYRNQSNQYAIKAINPNDTYSKEIDEYDIKGFTLNRKAWVQMGTDFRGTFIDADNDYSERVVLASNYAAEKLAGNKNVVSIDLKCFRDKDTASKRVWNIMKRDSYPIATIKFTTNFKYGLVFPGDILRVYHELYGLAGVDFRVVSISQVDFDKQEINIEAKQQVETLYDDNFVTSGETEWVDQPSLPVDLTEKDAFEMPYNSQNKSILLLAGRKTLIERGVDIKRQAYGSTGDYFYVQTLSTFATKMTVMETYNYTSQIDDSVGIKVVPVSGVFDPEEISITRLDLFNQRRCLVFPSGEIVAFQNVEAITGGYRLYGLVRGILGTAISSSYIANSTCWVCRITDDNTIINDYNSYNYKFYPIVKQKTYAGVTSAIAMNMTNKFNTPPAVARIEAVRSGTSVTIQLWPCNILEGAGIANEDVTDQEPPFEFNGVFNNKIGSTEWTENTDSYIINQAGSFTLEIRAFVSGIYSSTLSIVIGASDGTYTASKALNQY